MNRNLLSRIPLSSTRTYQLLMNSKSQIIIYNQPLGSTTMKQPPQRECTSEHFHICRSINKNRPLQGDTSTSLTFWSDISEFNFHILMHVILMVRRAGTNNMISTLFFFLQLNMLTNVYFSKNFLMYNINVKNV